MNMKKTETVLLMAIAIAAAASGQPQSPSPSASESKPRPRPAVSKLPPTATVHRAQSAVPIPYKKCPLAPGIRKVTVVLNAQTPNTHVPNSKPACRLDTVTFHFVNATGLPQQVKIDDSQNPFLAGDCKTFVPLVI